MIASGMIVAAGMLAASAAGGLGSAQTAWYEGFEGPQRSWREASGNAQYRVIEHRRVQHQAHTGDGCEQISVYGSGGTEVYFSHQVDHPRVIDELLPTVWVKSDRSGLQLLARVVLPRTPDPRTGRPVSTLLRGSVYNDVGRWQQLRIDRIPRLLASQVRILRSQLGPHVDGREAYVDRILLNVYGGAGTTNLWIDDLDVGGHFSAAGPAADAAGSDGSAAPADYDPGAAIPVGAAAAEHGDYRRVELTGSVLMVDGRPFFPRMIRHRGEPLAFLKQLRFNAVWLGRSDPTQLVTLAAEAQRLDMWLVCPAPEPHRPQRAGRVDAEVVIGPHHRRVLAWDLGQGLSRQQLERTRSWAELVHAADRRARRPLVCQADSELRAYGRGVDFLLLQRRPLGTSLELAEFGRWIRRRGQLAPATLFWTTIQTQPSEELRRQLTVLEPGRQPPSAVAAEQIRLLAYTAVASGSRGLLFDSQSPLDATDPQTRRRAMALELLNLELGLIEPWAAAGSLMAAATGNRPELTGTVLRADRSRLLLPIWAARGAQLVPDQSAANAVSLLVPGVPESGGAYRIDAGGLQPLRHERVTGGVRVSFDEFGLTTAVLLSQDPLAISTLSTRSAAIGPRTGQLWRHLAVEKLHAVEQLAAEIGGYGLPVERTGDWIDAARKDLQSCDGYLAARDYWAACLHARRAMRGLRLVEWAHWQRAIEGLASPLSSPATVSFATLPWQAQLTRRMASSRWGPNLLGGGEFDNLAAVLGAGWNHRQHPADGLIAAADLLPEAARSGFSGLRISVRAEDPKRPPAVIESPPVWITSPAVPVEAGDLIGMEGWVRIRRPISGSVDGLLIIDSLSGEDLAHRIGRTGDWEQFVVYRLAPQSGTMRVTFALSGLGEAWLDDVTIRRVLPREGSGVARFPGPNHGPH